MKRVAQTIRLRPERREEYLALHREVWPGVEAALRKANIRNYTIFLRETTLFSYFEYHGEDFAADLASIAADPDTRRWWTLTDPCQQPWPDAGAGGHWSDLQEIWHLTEEAPA
jgi:L-rhamnose mutarotase